MTSTSQTTQVYDQIMTKVFSGDYAPGAKIVERDLADELQVSRMPVRMALSQLVAQGILVGGQKQRSVRMREYPPGEIAQLYQFREIIECGAVRAAGQCATAEQLAAIDQICDQMQAEVAKLRFDARWSNLDHAYHASFAHASGNQWLIQSIDSLLKQSHYVLYCLRWKLRPDMDANEIRQRKQNNVNIHRQVVQCIRVGDIDGAEETMRGHIRRSTL